MEKFGHEMNGPGEGSKHETHLILAHSEEIMTLIRETVEI